MGTRSISHSPRPKNPKEPTKVLKPSDILVTRLSPKPETTTPIVEIYWIDAQAVGGEHWVDETDIDTRGAETLTLGYILNETPETITLVSLVNNNHYSHGITIPKGCIKHINRLQ